LSIGTLSAGNSTLTITGASGAAIITYVNASDALQINKATAIGSSSNYALIGGGGDLTFVGTADYLVGGNDWAFRYSGDEDAGIYFNLTGTAIEMRSIDGSAVASFNVSTKDSSFIGNVITNKAIRRYIDPAAIAGVSGNLINEGTTARVGVGTSVTLYCPLPFLHEGDIINKYGFIAATGAQNLDADVTVGLYKSTAADANSQIGIDLSSGDLASSNWSAFEEDVANETVGQLESFAFKIVLDGGTGIAGGAAIGHLWVEMQTSNY